MMLRVFIIFAFIVKFSSSQIIDEMNGNHTTEAMNETSMNQSNYRIDSAESDLYELNGFNDNLTDVKNSSMISTSTLNLVNFTTTKIEDHTKPTTISSTSEEFSNLTSDSSTTSQPPSDLTSSDIFKNLNFYLNSKVPIFCYLATIFLLTLTNIVTLIACCCCIRRRKTRMSHTLVDNKFGHALYDVSSRAIPPRPPRATGRDNSTLLVNNHRSSALSQDGLKPLERRESTIYENTRYF